MTRDEQALWDERYSSGEYQPRTEPSPIVERAIEYIGSGRALVLACGSGRNALRLAQAGFEVTALDISSVAIGMAKEAAASRGLEVDWVVSGVDDFDLTKQAFDLITMIRYVNRSIWPLLQGSLTADGWLLMEQHLHTYRLVLGPSDDFRIHPGELLDAFSGMRVIEYSELVEPSEAAEGVVATTRLLACKGDPGW